MTRTQLRVVDSEQPHNLDIARQRIAEWRSNAEQQALPTTNTTTDSGASLLDRDAVVRASYPNYAQDSQRRRGLLRRLLRWR